MRAIGLDVDQVVEDISVRPALSAEAAALGIPAGSPVLLIERDHRCGDRIVEAGEIVIPADRFRLRYRFPVRRGRLRAWRAASRAAALVRPRARYQSRAGVPRSLPMRFAAASPIPSTMTPPRVRRLTTTRATAASMTNLSTCCRRLASAACCRVIPDAGAGPATARWCSSSHLALRGKAAGLPAGRDRLIRLLHVLGEPVGRHASLPRRHRARRFDGGPHLLPPGWPRTRRAARRCRRPASPRAP